MAKGTGGVSTRRLSRDSGGASPRDIGWSQNSSHRPSLAQTNSAASSDHSTASTQSTRSSLSRSQHGLSRAEQRRLQLSEQMNAHAASVDGENLASNTKVKGTTLELLALIKKRRQARARGRDSVTSSQSEKRASLSPKPSGRTGPTPQRSISFSPQGRHRSNPIKKLPIPDVPTSPESQQKDKSAKKWSFSTHSTFCRKPNLASSPRGASTFNNSDSTFSANSFHDAGEDVPNNKTRKNSDSGADDVRCHDSPTGVMDFHDARKTSAIDPAHQAKMKRMRAEMQELQDQLAKMEEAKAQDMQELKDHFATRKSDMVESAKKKIQAHLDAEWEIKLHAMEVEKTRLDKMQEVLQQGKEELMESIADVQADIDELMKENNRLDAENKEIHNMYTHLSKWVMKTTKHNKKLEEAEKKLKTIYNGSVALIVEEKLSTVYRKFMYKVAQGVSTCEGFDFELNEDVWKIVKEVEEECNKPLLDLQDIDEWTEELEFQEDNSPLAFLRTTRDQDTVSDVMTTSTLDGSKCSKNSLPSITALEVSSRSRGSRSTRSSGSYDEDDSMEDESEYESETEHDDEEGGEFEEDMERLNKSAQFYENVLAEVSVNLDANQMNTLHDNKDMLLSIFKFLDIDGSGDIDLEEFKVGIELLNKRLPEHSHFHDAEELFNMLDVDNSGAIHLEEFEKVFDGAGD